VTHIGHQRPIKYFTATGGFMMTTPDKPFDKIPEATRKEERLTEDGIARRKLGPRGVPGAPDTATMTQYEKNTPKEGEFDGHPA
jgi:hypothetical protein